MNEHIQESEEGMNHQYKPSLTQKQKKILTKANRGILQRIWFWRKKQNLQIYKQLKISTEKKYNEKLNLKNKSF